MLRSSFAGWCIGRPVRSALLLVVVAAGAGCRQDMHDAPRYDPLEKSTFFADEQSARPLVANTVARGLLREDRHFYEGVVDGKHFLFSASNPDACETAKPVNAFLQLIESAYQSKDPD